MHEFACRIILHAQKSVHANIEFAKPCGFRSQIDHYRDICFDSEI